jgi:hypothetical protein
LFIDFVVGEENEGGKLHGSSCPADSQPVLSTCRTLKYRTKACFALELEFFEKALLQSLEKSFLLLVYEVQLLAFCL